LDNFRYYCQKNPAKDIDRLDRMRWTLFQTLGSRYEYCRVPLAFVTLTYLRHLRHDLKEGANA
jgi:hypothetical protein